MPETLLDALRSLAKDRGYESPALILARQQPPKAATRPKPWWKV